MAAIAAYHSRYAPTLYPFVAFAWRLVLILTLARIALVAWQWERVTAVDMLWPIFAQGLRFDLVLLGILSVIPVLLWPFLAATQVLLPGWRLITKIYFPLALLIVLFMELSTPSFVQQFDFRPNILFVEYLDRPGEVFATLWGAYRFPLIFSVLAAAGFAWLSVRQFARMAAQAAPTGIIPALLLMPFLLLLCLAAVRSTTDHRPVNPSTVALSTDPLANELALSSTYTVLYSIYETGEDERGGIRYARMDFADVVSEVRDAMDVAAGDFSSAHLPTLHFQHAPAADRSRKNLVLIIEESLGAEFVGSLGGLDLTPRLDELSVQGLWFSNLFATGTRSVRGLEALITGFTPTPARSVVKLPKSQRGFFTLAELLGNLGYESSFIYGGEAQFDNMRRFFANNGFDTVHDKHDFETTVFTGSWGASDEDVFNYAHQQFVAHDPNTPFFSVLFTTSNHSPWEFPDDRIEFYELPRNTVNNAVKYADHALGEFFKRAAKAAYWDNTVFVVVADHNSRVYGADLVPIERFHIPGLIIGGGIEPQRIERLTSQIDLLPTALSLIGVSGVHPAVGLDLTRADINTLPGRAIMQYGDTQAYREEDRVVILRKEKPAAVFRYQDGKLVAAAPDDELIAKAMTMAVWPVQSYREGSYRLPASIPGD
jgi:phosphoglycerol transferase MdoB-like AlkP superfamily enzyme